MIRTLTPIFSVIIALMVFLFVTKPIFGGIQVIQDDTEKYSTAVEQATKLNNKLTSFITQMNGFSTIEKERLNALVPSEIDEVKVLADLKDLTQKHNMLLGNVHVTEEQHSADTTETAISSQNVTYSDLVSTDVSFSLIGTYTQFKEVLREIEKSLVIMEVVGVSFRAGSGDLMQFETTVRLYALPDSE
jgi:phosphate/sulfate permease